MKPAFRIIFLNIIRNGNLLVIYHLQSKHTLFVDPIKTVLIRKSFMRSVPQ